MSQVANSVCELLPSEPCDLYGLRPRASGSRTLLKQYFLDPVLPMLTLLSMSALTVVMLVVIVTTVADMDMRLPDSYVNADPWAGVSVGTTGGFYPEQSAYADLAGPLDDREFWSAPQNGDPF